GAHRELPSPPTRRSSDLANGVVANINQQIDFDTAAIVAAEMGYEVTLETPEADEEEDQWEIPLWRRVIEEEDPAELETRPPVVRSEEHTSELQSREHLVC